MRELSQWLVSIVGTTVFLSLFVGQSLFAQCPSGELSGRVFLDYDLNGDLNPLDVGEANILVRVYDKNGSLAASATTNANGAYSLNLQDGEEYRVEIVYGQTFQTTMLGGDHKSDIRYTSIPNCEVNFGLVEKGFQCADNPDIMLTCFVRGSYSEYQDYATIVSLEHDFDPGSSVSVLANKGETGSIWGLSYNASANELYSSAFVKQYAALTPNGHDAIFKTDLTTGSTSLFTNLSTLGINTGTLPVTDSQDCDYGEAVGKYGIGNIAISEDENSLYVIDIYNNSLVNIPLANPTATNTGIYAIPNPGCNGGNPRAFALNYHNGRYYIGVTCDALNSQDQNDLTIHVYEFDPSSKNFGLVFSTDYAKGYWMDTPANQFITSHWLTDIDFSDEGLMMLALSDRFGHRYCNGATGRVDQQFPDLLVAWNDNGTWRLESNGTAGSLVGSGANNSQGPDGGEFFGNDFYAGDPQFHSEVALGSILAIEGTGQVITSAYDPVYSTYSGGLHRYNTEDGTLVNLKELYSNNLTEYFGKATGFGEIISACPKLSPEVGNYVWEDTNGDGIQGSDEPILTNIPVVLYDQGCNLVGNTTTDADGNYAFNNSNVIGGLLPNTDYYIALDPSITDSGTFSYNVNGTTYNVTVANSNAALGSDIVLNNTTCLQGSIIHLANVNIPTSSTIDHSYDIGLVVPQRFDLALKKTLETPYPISIGDELTFKIEVYNQGDVAATSVEITDYMTPNFGFDPNSNPGWSTNGTTLRFTYDNVLLPGQSFTVYLDLRLQDRLPKEFANYAEISNTLDQFGKPNNDADSVADSDNTNDNGAVPGTATDNEINGDGTFDEDDHDVALLEVLDIALKKTVRENKLYQVGDEVTYDIGIYNQGNVDITTFEVVDHFPGDLVFDQTRNVDWTLSANNLATYVFSGNLPAGQTTTVSITFTISSFDENGKILNTAEVASVTGTNAGMNDLDSTPDMDMDNDPVMDDMIDDLTGEDEDDHDIAEIGSLKVDLALIKMVDVELVKRGGEVTFTIYVLNQGEVTVDNIVLVDYLPEYMVSIDPNWSYNANTHTARQTLVVPGGIAPNGVASTTIQVRVKIDAELEQLVNTAEIVSATDLNGNNIGNLDIDSTPDDIRGNDSGGVPGTQFDDFVHGNGSNDEDDSDPALVYVADYEVVDPCVCLSNASPGTAGQFLTTIHVTAPSNQSWYIDYVDGLYDPSSIAPAPLTPYMTGPNGYTLNLISSDDGYSVYEMTGIHLDGLNYDVRLANEFGYFLQIEEDACTYNEANVGDPDEEASVYAACISTTREYETNLGTDCLVTWTLSSGGTFADGSTVFGPTAEETITVNWGATAGTFTLDAEVDCPTGCDSPATIVVDLGISNGVLACVDDLHISLDGDCEVEITAALVLENNIDPFAGYGVMLFDLYDHPIPGNVVGPEHVGEVIKYKVIDACSGNSCWAHLVVEDKYPPVIQCGDITMDCNELLTYEPIANDNCGTVAEVVMLSETITPYNCHPTYVKEITRSYMAIDDYGNESEPCEQTIQVERFDFASVLCPPNYLIDPGPDDLPAKTCSEMEYNEDGTPAIEITGVPSYNGFDIYPFPDVYCNVGVDFEDFIISEVGCVKKYMRTWTFYEAWCGLGEIYSCTQTIEVRDELPPMFDCQEDMVLTTSGVSCNREVFLALPENIEDDCTEEDFVADIMVEPSASFPGAFFEGVTEGVNVTLPAGNHIVNFTIYDQCANSNACTVNVFISDETNPVAACDEFTVVGLRGDGTAEAFAHTFDDGSYDDCQIHKFLVRKMDPNDDCPCNTPYFSDMDYLGEYNNHFYYVSKNELPANLAYAYANSMGGHPVILETTDENSWVRTKADSLIPNQNYYIGLNDLEEDGVFKWNNGFDIIDENWQAGSPVNVGNYVQADAAGSWFVTNGAAKSRYIFEISDPCGWSEMVNFCCSEVETEQTVIFRVVDYFGLTNQCMVTVEVQDKIPPQITCPPDAEIPCDTPYDLNNLGAFFGDAVATDSCKVELVEILPPATDLDQCGVGTITRKWRANDDNGFSECEQVITVTNPFDFDEDDIVWPRDTIGYLGCSTDDLHPDNLDAPYDYPIVQESHCDLIGVSFYDEQFFFTSQEDNACYKILRTWEVINWCYYNVDDPDLNDVDEPEDDDIIPGFFTHRQTIKVNDIVDPTIESGCEEETVCTTDCDNGFITLIAVGDDTCTDAENLFHSYELDLDADGEIDFTLPTAVGSTIVASGEYPVGTHTILYTFEDGCGNKTSCLKTFTIMNCKTPTAVCKEGLSIGLEPMDLTGPNGEPDGIPDTEMACVNANAFDASSFHPCPDIGFIVVFCDPNNPENYSEEMCFDCNDCGLQEVTICIIDDFGNTDHCITTIEVQDNNNVDLCPDPLDCITPPVATLEVSACQATLDLDPDVIGGKPQVDIACLTNLDANNEGCDDEITDQIFCDDWLSFTDEFMPYPNLDCKVVTRTWKVSPICGCVSNEAEFVQEIILMDALPPAIACPADPAPVNDTDGNCTQFVNVGVPTDLMNCGGTATITHNSTFAIAPNSSNASGNYPIGTTTVTFTMTNDCGTTNCSVDVIVRDVTAPDCNDIGTIDPLKLDANGNTTLNASAIGFSGTDCSGIGQLLINGGSSVSFDCEDIGDQTVTVTLTDNATPANTINCPVTVEILDNTAPICGRLETDIFTVDLLNANSASVNLLDLLMFDIDGLDNCNQDGNVNVVPSMFTYTCDDVGTQTENVVLSDGQNTVQCSVTFNVIDSADPTCNFDNPDITLNVGETVTIAEFGFNPASSDNCGTALVTNFQPFILTCDDETDSPLQLTLPVSDGNGNSTNCPVTVTVVDNAVPICNIRDEVEICIEQVPGTVQWMAFLTTGLVDLGSSSGCEDAPNITLSQTEFPCNTILNNPNPVTVTVCDPNNTNNCCTSTVNVTVVDKIAPIVTCIDDVTIDCIDPINLNDLSDYGELTIFNNVDDNCQGLVTIDETVVDGRTECGQGEIIRTFTVTDPSGNTDQCSQTITIENDTNPLSAGDFIPQLNDIPNASCNSIPDAVTPVVSPAFNGCENAILSSFNEVVENQSGAGDCSFDIVRTWTYTDDCQDDDIVLTQRISVEDTEDPTIVPIPDVFMELEACFTEVSFLVRVSDDCTSDNLFTFSTTGYNGEFTVTDNNDANDNGRFTFTGVFCDGENSFNLNVADACGNTVSTPIVVDIDGKCSIPFCRKLITELETDGTYELAAEELIRPWQDDPNICPNINYQFSFSPTDINDNMLSINCGSFPDNSGNISTPVYFWEDGAPLGQEVSCFPDDRPAVASFSNYAEECLSPLTEGAIQGRITRVDNSPVEDVAVELMGSDFDVEMSSTEGYFAFPTMEYGGNYVINPHKNTEPLNGVSTLDIILMQKHILGQELFDSPYTHIAGDVNRSGSVTSIDIVELRKLILGTYEEFPNNTSWRMIDAEYAFPDPSNPFYQELPEVYNINQFDTPMMVEFVGVKIGDVNNTAIANVNNEESSFRTSKYLQIEYSDVELIKDENFEIEFTTDLYSGIQGAQFEIAFENQMVTNLELHLNEESLVKAENVNFDLLTDGVVRVSWHLNEAISSDVTLPLFNLTGTAISDNSIKSIISMPSKSFSSEAYQNDLPIEIVLGPTGGEKGDLIILYQNTPNPWSDQTTIAFYVEQTQNVEINLFDINGRLIKNIEVLANSGTNNINITKNDIPSNGVVYYELISDKQRITKKMLLLR